MSNIVEYTGKKYELVEDPDSCKNCDFEPLCLRSSIPEDLKGGLYACMENEETRWKEVEPEEKEVGNG